MNVLLAFDKFKDSLTAEEACGAAARVIRDARPEWRIKFAPLTDGGDGFCRILTEAVRGKLVEHSVTGPRFELATAQIGWVDLPTLKLSLRQSLGIPDRGRLAIVEMAQSSGLAMLSPEHRDIWKTSSLGTGELLAGAAREGAAAILLGGWRQRHQRPRHGGPRSPWTAFPRKRGRDSLSSDTPALAPRSPRFP